MPDLSVLTRFTAKDNAITAAFRRMGKAADKFGRRADKSFNKASKSAGRLQSITSNLLLAGAIQRGVGAATTGIGRVIGEYAKLDGVAIAAAARFEDVGPSAKNFSQQVRAIKTAARETALGTKFAATETGEALDFMARAGMGVRFAIGGLPSAVAAATAAGEDLNLSMDHSVDLFASFGLNMGSTANKIEGWNRLNYALAGANNASNVTLEDLFETLKIGAPIARGAGFAMEEIVATAGLLGTFGIKGSIGGTVLKNTITNLAAVTPKAQKMMDKLGVTTRGVNKEFLPLNTIMSNFSKKLKTLSKPDQIAALNDVFGRRVISGAAGLTKQIDALALFAERMSRASRQTNAMADAINHGLDVQFLKLANSALDVGFRIFDAFGKDGKAGISAFKIELDKLNVGPFITTIKVTGKVLGLVIRLVKFISPVLVPALIAWGVASAYTAVRMAALNAASFIFSATSIPAMFGGLASLSEAWVAFNLVLTANPFGAIVIGAAAAIALVYQLEKRFGFFTSVLDTLHLSWLRTGLADIIGQVMGVDVSGKSVMQADTLTPEMLAAYKKGRQVDVNIGGSIDVKGGPVKSANVTANNAPIVTAGELGWN